MPALKFPNHDITIGTGAPLTVIAGLNVLEDEKLAMTIGRHLKDVCERLELPYIFKASFDKANRSSIKSYRGPGLEDGLAILAYFGDASSLNLIKSLFDHADPQTRYRAQLAARAIEREMPILFVAPHYSR